MTLFWLVSLSILALTVRAAWRQASAADRAQDAYEARERLYKRTFGGG